MGDARRISETDAKAAERHDAGASWAQLAARYDVSATACRKAAARHWASANVADVIAHERAKEIRRGKSARVKDPATRPGTGAAASSGSRAPKPERAHARIHPRSDGSFSVRAYGDGPMRIGNRGRRDAYENWLDRRDAARDAANDPVLLAEDAERDRIAAESRTGLKRDADGVFRPPAGTRWSRARQAFVPATEPEPLIV